MIQQMQALLPSARRAPLAGGNDLALAVASVTLSLHLLNHAGAQLSDHHPHTTALASCALSNTGSAFSITGLADNLLCQAELLIGSIVQIFQPNLEPEEHIFPLPRAPSASQGLQITCFVRRSFLLAPLYKSSNPTLSLKSTSFPFLGPLLPPPPPPPPPKNEKRSPGSMPPPPPPPPASTPFSPYLSYSPLFFSSERTS